MVNNTPVYLISSKTRKTKLREFRLEIEFREFKPRVDQIFFKCHGAIENVFIAIDTDGNDTQYYDIFD